MHPIPVVLVAAALAGCGGGSGGSSGTSDASSVSSTPAATTPTQAQTQTTAPRPSSGADGAKVFASAGCGGCHTLKAAGSTGNVGPDLDDLKPSADAVKAQVTDGGGGMPAFGGSLSSAEIAAVATYVATNAGR